jgi:hypothetical protein
MGLKPFLPQTITSNSVGRVIEPARGCPLILALFLLPSLFSDAQRQIQTYKPKAQAMVSFEEASFLVFV